MEKTLNYLIVLLSIIVAGCTLSRSMDVKVAGNNIKTIYGDGDVDLGYKSNTQVGVLDGRK